MELPRSTPMGLALLLYTLVLCTLQPAGASAQDDTEAESEALDEAAAPERAPAIAVETLPLVAIHQGLQLQGSIGLSDCLGEYCSDGTATFDHTRAALGFMVSGWYRPAALLGGLFGVGGGLHYNILGTNNRRGADSWADYFNVDLGGRVYPLRQGPFEAFAGLTLGYTWEGTSWEAVLPADGSFTFSGFTLGLSAGGDYYFTPRMSVGALFKFYLPLWWRGCLGQDATNYEDCDDIDHFEDTIVGFSTDDLPTMWYLGGTFSYHLDV